MFPKLSPRLTPTNERSSRMLGSLLNGIYLHGSFRGVHWVLQEFVHHKYEFWWGGCLITTFRYIDGKGLKRICGGVDLKKSQHYPALFGHSVAQLYQREASAIQEEVKKQQKLGSVGYQLLSFITAELIEIYLWLRCDPTYTEVCSFQWAFQTSMTVNTKQPHAAQEGFGVWKSTKPVEGLDLRDCVIGVHKNQTYRRAGTSRFLTTRTQSFVIQSWPVYLWNKNICDSASCKNLSKVYGIYMCGVYCIMIHLCLYIY